MPPFPNPPPTTPNHGLSAPHSSYPDFAAELHASALAFGHADLGDEREVVAALAQWGAASVAPGHLDALIDRARAIRAGQGAAVLS